MLQRFYSSFDQFFWSSNEFLENFGFRGLRLGLGLQSSSRSKPRGSKYRVLFTEVQRMYGGVKLVNDKEKQKKKKKE